MENVTCQDCTCDGGECHCCDPYVSESSCKCDNCECGKCHCNDDPT